ncbi:hypothetical protein M426DRAFT_325671 [Hypoxylon sp. CI-4A]|nr:hypothetical protein M426DRAFT_325671 [Hypoxylon sp. CI-4A]
MFLKFYRVEKLVDRLALSRDSLNERVYNSRNGSKERKESRGRKLIRDKRVKENLRLRGGAEAFMWNFR